MFAIENFSANQSLVDSLYSIDNEYPWRKDDFYKSLSQEVAEKVNWLGEELINLDTDKKIVNWYAAGFCFYESILLQKLNFTDVCFYDYDPSVKHVNWKTLYHLKEHMEFNQVCLDVVLDREFVRKSEVVINTSCELMYNMDWCTEKYKRGTLMAFQGTNKMHRGNINVHSDINEFIVSLPRMNIIYAKTKVINYNNRYMVIGYKL
jgi:hypothetical protein